MSKAKPIAGSVKSVKSRIVVDEIALDASDKKTKQKKKTTNTPDGSPSGGPKQPGKMQSQFVENIIKTEVDPKTSIKAIFWPDQPTDVREKLTLTAVERISSELATNDMSNVLQVTQEFDGSKYTAFYYVPDDATEADSEKLKLDAATMLATKIEDMVKAKYSAALLAEEKEKELVGTIKDFLTNHGGPAPIKVVASSLDIKPAMVHKITTRHDSTFSTGVLGGQNWVMLNSRNHLLTFRYQQSNY